ncbi:MAG: rhomboid family protein [Bryobacteraceae bacterium]
MTLAQQRCFIHEFREAVARCPVCRNSFCRECVTEHQGRVVCTACLKQLHSTKGASQRKLLRLVSGVLPIAGLLLAWLVFYSAGRILTLIPADVHDGTAWSK